jgi:hypothetical protein
MDDQSGSEMEWTWLLDAYETERRDLIEERVAEVQNDRATWLFYIGMMSVDKQTAERCGTVDEQAEEKDEEIENEDEIKGTREMGLMVGYEAAPRAEADCAARTELSKELIVPWAERAWRKPLARMIQAAARRLQKYMREKAGAIVKIWRSGMKSGRAAEKNRVRRATKRNNKKLRMLMAARDTVMAPRMLAAAVMELKKGMEHKAKAEGLAMLLANQLAISVWTVKVREAKDAVCEREERAEYEGFEDEEKEQDEELELEDWKCAEISDELTDMCNEWTAGCKRVSSDDDWTDGCSVSSQGAETDSKNQTACEIAAHYAMKNDAKRSTPSASGARAAYEMNSASGDESDESDESTDLPKTVSNCGWIADIAAHYALENEARRSTPSAIGARAIYGMRSAFGDESDESDGSDESSSEDDYCSTWRNQVILPRKSKDTSGCAGVRARDKKVMQDADYAWGGFDVG